MRLLASAFVLATAADGVTLAWLPPGAEQNPLVAPLPLPIAWAAKVALIVLVGAVVTALLERGRYRAIAELALIVGVAAGCLGAGSNIAAAAPWPALPTTLQPGPEPVDADAPTRASIDDGRATEDASAGPTTAPSSMGRVGGAVPPGGIGTPIVGGIASTYGPACRVRCLALPEGPGHRVRICGPAECVTRTSNDAGPSLAMQRQGRVVDLSLRDFERVSGRSWRTGLVRVTVEYLGRGPQPTLPPTDTEPWS